MWNILLDYWAIGSLLVFLYFLMSCVYPEKVRIFLVYAVTALEQLKGKGAEHAESKFEVGKISPYLEDSALHRPLNLKGSVYSALVLATFWPVFVLVIAYCGTHMIARRSKGNRS